MFPIYLFIYSYYLLKTHRFKSCVLFGTHTLLDKSVRILQLPTHLYDLTTNGYYYYFGILDCIH